jgi:hypothetical protein
VRFPIVRKESEQRKVLRPPLTQWDRQQTKMSRVVLVYFCDIIAAGSTAYRR